MNILSEDQIEQMALQTLQDQLYKIINGATIERDYGEVVLVSRLQNAIDKINPGIPKAIKNVLRVHHTTLLANNEAFHKLLTEGVGVKGSEGDQVKTFKVRLVDFSNVRNND